MDYSEFTLRDEAYAGFVKYRKSIIEEADKGELMGAFSEMCAKAIDGDCVAQDCVAYFFSRGFDELQINYDLYMAWEILAGANGNEFALEKLNFFIDPALNTIVYNKDILKRAMVKGNLNKENALAVIGNVVCEAIADELQLDPKKLISIENKPINFTPALKMKYYNAMEKSIDRVIDYLMS